MPGGIGMFVYIGRPQQEDGAWTLFAVSSTNSRSLRRNKRKKSEGQLMMMWTTSVPFLTGIDLFADGNVKKVRLVWLKRRLEDHIIFLHFQIPVPAKQEAKRTKIYSFYCAFFLSNLPRGIGANQCRDQHNISLLLHVLTFSLIQSFNNLQSYAQSDFSIMIMLRTWNIQRWQKWSSTSCCMHQRIIGGYTSSQVKTRQQQWWKIIASKSLASASLFCNNGSVQLKWLIQEAIILFHSVLAAR
jgi:hypothetical protein